MPVKINGATSGSVTLAAPATGSDVTLTLPAAAGTAATTAYADTAGGLAHINTTTFSAVSSVSLNNVFTSDYENYRIVISGVVASTNTGSSFRLRVSGVDNSSTNYANFGRYMASVGYADFGTSSATSMGSLALNTNSYALGVYDLSNPNLAVHTYGVTLEAGRNSGGFIYNTSATYHNVATAYDGFTFFPSSGNITGTIRVYGYKNGA